MRGQRAMVVWAYRTIASVTSWSVSHETKTGWTLTARVDGTPSSYDLRQRPLLFIAPHPKGFWTWEILDAPRLDQRTLTARLGQPN